MGNLSEIDDHIQVPVNIEVFPYLRDHVFEKNAVFPAVESMQLLAASVRGVKAGLDVTRLMRAEFEKFLVISPQDEVIDACVELEKIQDGGMRAKLVTRRRLAGPGITRVKEHARACFFPHLTALETTASLNLVESKDDWAVSSDKVYGELVPFGPAYRNLSGMVRLNRTAAVAGIREPDLPFSGGPLGSPFVLDAAFHAACVWGQRYSGFIGFPVGFESRRVLNPTKPGEAYMAQVKPVTQGRSENIFNLWIYETGGAISEVVKGLRMWDVTGGRKKPPGWIQEGF